MKKVDKVYEYPLLFLQKTKNSKLTELFNNMF